MLKRPSRRRIGAISVSCLLLLGASCTEDAEWSGAPTDATPRVVAGATPPEGDPVSSGCADESVASGAQGATVESIVERAMADEGLSAVLYRVTRGGEVVASGGMGESMSGVPAAPSMHFRNGNVAFGYLGNLLMLMVEDGTVSLDDPISRWLPDLDAPSADEVTLAMLVRNTSGYADYVRDPDFQEQFLGDPFQQFSDQDLIDIAMTTPPWYSPGTSWSYAHTNYVILGQALSAAADRPLEQLLVERVLEPMGLRDTAPALTPAVPEPVLHTVTTEREVFEDSTFWNPSWQTARGSVLTTTICDMATSAAAIGTGELLTPASQDQVVDPVTTTLGALPEDCPDTVCRQWTDQRYYGLGVIVWSDWVAQTPLFGGAGAVHAYLPEQDLAVAIVAVQGQDSEPGVNYAVPIWQALAEALAPEHVPSS